MTVEELQQEVNLLTPDNIRRYPCGDRKYDFCSMASRHGLQAARYFMMPPIWDGRLPLPSEFIKPKK